MSSSTGRRFVVVVLVLAGLASACGIPVSGEVQYLAQDDRQELLQGTTSTTLPPATGGSTTIDIGLFFIGPDDKLERVIRQYPEAPKVNEVLADLEAGPLPAEIDQFEDLGTLQSLLPAGLSPVLGSRDEERGVQQVIVNPEAELRERLEEDLVTGRLIVSQIVCTILEVGLTNVTGVEIYDGEEAIPLSDNAAQPIIGPAMLEDFDNCTTGTQERQLLEEADADTETTESS